MKDFLDSKNKDKILAIGECGLDYERLFCAEEDIQKLVFTRHFDLAEQYKLPIVLHTRGSSQDFYDIVKANRNRFTNGMVHCFTGDSKEL